MRWVGKDDNGRPVFGIVAQKTKSGWKDYIPNMYVRGLSQEHGVVSVPKTEIDNYSIGDIIYVLPVHSCMTADLMKRYTTTEGNVITMMVNH